MAEPEVYCRDCGSKLANARLHNEQFLVPMNSKTIIEMGHQRMFIGECPEHGLRFASFPEEGHSTLAASKLRKQFSKAERRALRDALPPDERKVFQDSLNGKYAWDDSDVVRWKEQLGAVAP